MVQFINEKMHQTSLVLAAGNPVMSVQVNHDKNFAFIEVNMLLLLLLLLLLFYLYF